MNIDDLMNEIFSPGRDPRSQEYRHGVRAALEFKINGVSIPKPYEPGTASADAFYAGIDEGVAKWREKTGQKV